MKRLILFAALFVAAGSFACSSAPEVTADAIAEASPFNDVSIQQLSTMIEEKTAVTIYDVNGEETRKEFGIIPGAKLLSGSDALTKEDLPEAADSPIVFYCSSEKCSAAPKAATKAVTEFQRTNVHVLRDGIKGWVAANKTTEKASTITAAPKEAPEAAPEADKVEAAPEAKEEAPGTIKAAPKAP